MSDLAADAIANAVDAGWRYVTCPGCGAEGWWGREAETTACPLCDAAITYQPPAFTTEHAWADDPAHWAGPTVE
jgi:hypothetical protein